MDRTSGIAAFIATAAADAGKSTLKYRRRLTVCDTIPHASFIHAVSIASLCQAAHGAKLRDNADITDVNILNTRE